MVSVVAHLVGKQIKHMMGLLLEGDVEGAAAEHRRLLPLFKGMFVMSNPIPVKYSLNQIGFRAGNPRLPLVPPSLPLQTRNPSRAPSMVRATCTSCMLFSP